MIFIALAEADAKGELILVEGGMCRFYRRQDGTVVIREILTLAAMRGKGIGKEMVRKVICYNPKATLIRARCPSTYPSNGFWSHMGFSLIEIVEGVNVWEYRL